MMQSVLFTSCNKHFAVIFKYRNMAAITCKEQEKMSMYLCPGYLVVLVQVPGEWQIFEMIRFQGHLGPPEEARLWR